MPTFQAKLKVAKVERVNGWDQITAYPVYSPDPADPNYSYSQATPSGQLNLTISNQNLLGKIKENQVYLIDFTEVSAEPQVPAHLIPPPPAPPVPHSRMTEPSKDQEPAGSPSESAPSSDSPKSEAQEPVHSPS
jgi:hypothetical protein